MLGGNFGDGLSKVVDLAPDYILGNLGDAFDLVAPVLPKVVFVNGMWVFDDSEQSIELSLLEY